MYGAKLINQPSPDFDKFIYTHPYGHLLQSYAWGELKKHYGWQPLRIALVHKKQIMATISILMHQLVGEQTFFYAPRGPVLNFKDPQLLTALIDEVSIHARDQKAVFLKIDPPLPKLAYGFRQNLLKQGFRLVSQTSPQRSLQLTHVFRMKLPYVNTSHVALIKGMAKFNRLSVERSSSFDNLKMFYGLLLEFSTLNNVNVRTFDYYQRLWQLFKPTGINLFFLRQKNYIIGASLLIGFGNTCYSLYTVHRQSHLRLHPESFLHLAIMKWATNSSFSTYEIMDTFSSSNPGSFNRLFSFPIEPYAYIGEYDMVFLPLQYRIWQLLLPIYNWSVKNS